MKCAIVCAEGFEMCEALITVDLLKRADILIDVIGLEEKEVVSSHRIPIICDAVLKDVQLNEYDVLILPGGLLGTENLYASDIVQEAILKFNEEGKLICAICAAPSILGKLEILQDKKYTCYPGFEGDYGGTYTASSVVKDGNIITAKGMGVTIDFAKEIITTIEGEEVAKSVLDSIQCEA